jgi:hypothetical protein
MLKKFCAVLVPASAVLLCLLAWPGCGSSSPPITIAPAAVDAAPPRLSQKGEACRTSSDCGDKLACVPISGSVSVCSTAVFNIKPTGKECVASECLDAAECCAARTNPSCADYLMRCKDIANGQQDSGTNVYCRIYEQQCKCDSYTCKAGVCGTACTTPSDCQRNGSGQYCVAGSCVQCMDDTSCPQGSKCVANRCEAGCKGDGDCLGFSRCKEGQCVASGCQTDRECIIATRKVDSKCAAGKCVTSCTADTECSNGEAFSFFACANNQCTYTGCETEKDCRILNSGTGANGSLNPRHVQCVAKP